MVAPESVPLMLMLVSHTSTNDGAATETPIPSIRIQLYRFQKLELDAPTSWVERGEPKRLLIQ